jgi:hypothetical protein
MSTTDRLGTSTAPCTPLDTLTATIPVFDREPFGVPLTIATTFVAVVDQMA